MPPASNIAIKPSAKKPPKHKASTGGKTNQKTLITSAAQKTSNGYSSGAGKIPATGKTERGHKMRYKIPAVKILQKNKALILF